MGALDWAKNMFTGGAEQLASGIIDNFLGGIGERRRARINYEYGEKAAENAYRRQMKLYQITKQDNSPEARREQLEAAGLSPGLMYGGNGSVVGGGAGATSGAPQGASGTSPSMTDIGDPYAFTMAKAQMEQAKANAEEAKARAEEAKASANRQNKEADGLELENEFNKTVMPFRKLVAKTNAYQNFSNYVNERERNNEAYDNEEPGVRMYSDEFGAGFKIIAGNSLNSQEMRLRYDTLGEQYELLKKQKEYQIILNNISFEDYVHYEKRFALAVKEADAKAIAAEAERIMAEAAQRNAKTNSQNATTEAYRVNAYITDIEHKYGISLTPWQVGERVIDMLMTGIGLYVSKGAGAAKAQKTTQEAKEILREKYDSDGTFKGTTYEKTSQTSTR